MIHLTSNRMKNAAAKAKQVRLFVRMFAWRQYQTRTPRGHVYAVRFETRAGQVHASCNCAAGSKSLPCYHVASVYPVDVAVVTMRMEHVKQLEEKHRAANVLVKDQPKSLGRLNGFEI